MGLVYEPTQTGDNKASTWRTLARLKFVAFSTMPLPPPAFDLPGVQSFDGTADDVINLPHDNILEIAEATIAFSFIATNVTTRQGLVTKDASGFAGGGNHLAMYINKGDFVVRFQDGSTSTFLSLGGLVAGQEYEVAATFGAGGVQLYVDGVLIGSDSSHIMSWTGNQEYLQIGGLGWGSQTGQSGFTDPLAGQMADVQIFDQVLDASQIAELASNSVPGNTAPVAAPDTASVAEDDAVTISVLANDTDADGDSITISGLGVPGNGSVAIDDNGTPGDQTDDRIVYTPDADFNGTDSFTYTISDGRGGSATGAVDITVTPEPDVPDAVNDTATAQLGTPVVIPVLANDNDPDGDTLQVSAVTQGTDGAVAINPDGTVTYTAGAGFPGTDSFTYTIIDGNGGTDTATVTISSFPSPVFDLPGVQSFSGSNGDVINLPPAANLNIAEATIAFSFTADTVNSTQGLFTKDASGFAGGGNHLAIYIQNGTLTARFQDGTASTMLTQGGLAAGQEYEIAATFGANGIELYVDGVLVGSDTGHIMSWTGNQEYLQIGGLGWGSQTGQSNFTNPFSGQIADVQIYDQVLDATQIAELASTAVPGNTSPIAAADATTIAEDGSATIEVLANDTDADGDPLAITGTAAPGNGSVSIDDNGTPIDQTDDRIVYTPNADFNGADSFTYIISDGRGGTATGTVDVTVTPVPDAPIAAGDTASAQLGTPVIIPVLANDTDADGDPLQVIAVTPGSNGAVAINPDGTVTYTPGVGFQGSDSFTYTVSDGNGGTDIAVVTIKTFNAAPRIATGISAFDRQIVDTTMPLTHVAVAADFDGDGDIDLASTSEQDDTVAWFENDGNLNFTKRVIDPSLESAYPLSIADVDQDGDVDILAGGYRADQYVLYDNDGSGNFTKNVILTENGAHSIVAADIDGDGDNDLVTASQDASTISWLENVGDTFTQRVIDAGASAAKTALTADVDGDGDIDIISTENASDRVSWYENDGAGNFAVRIISSSANGAYYAVAGDLDGDGDQDIVSASQVDNTIAWYRNDGTNNFSKITIDNTALGARSVLTADLDGDGDVDVLAASVDDDTIAFYENAGDGTFTTHVVSDLVDGAYGVEAFDVDLDGQLDVLSAGRNDGTISVHLQSKAHTLDVAAAGLVQIDQSVLRAVDPDNTPLELTFTVLTAPTAGELRLDGTALSPGGTFTQQDIDDNRLTYVHLTLGQNTDIFTFTLADGGQGGLTPARGSFTVNVVAPPPSAADDSATTAEDQAVSIDVLANDSDPGGLAISLLSAGTASNGAVVINDNGTPGNPDDDTLTYTPNADFFGADTFVYTLGNSSGGADTATVNVTVTPVPDAPDAVDDAATALAGTPAIIPVLDNDTDADGDTFLVTSVTQGTDGSVVINPDGTVTYTPGAGYTGSDSFTYTIDDGNGGTDTASVSVSAFPLPVFELSGLQTYGGTSGDVVNLPHDTNLEIAEATIAFSFVANDVTPRQGLVTKDASGFVGGGNHLAIYVDKGDLNARFQDGSTSSVLSQNGLVDGREYEVAATFGADGVQLYVDGVLVGADSSHIMSWETNQEYLQIGGLGWGSQAGQSDYTNPLAGQIADVQIFDQVLEQDDLLTLASESSFDMFGMT